MALVIFKVRFLPLVSNHLACIDLRFVESQTAFLGLVYHLGIFRTTTNAMSKKSARPVSKQRPSLRNLVSELVDRATQRRHRSQTLGNHQGTRPQMWV